VDADLAGALFGCEDGENADRFLGTDFQRANLRQSSLDECDLTLAVNLNQRQLDAANGDRFTKLPRNRPELNVPKKWLSQ
jgi:uncharacterized protein YjbI with pentapeptide repeats